jgi:hypothetical protein
MTQADVRRALSVDLPENVLRALAVRERNRLIVDRWIEDRSTWGKTLVFATSIDHADALAQMFTEHGVEARSLHSRSSEHPGETLTWFREGSGEPVLVSVGMLTEGVDLPDAQTAFLARPTTSGVLMRQMVGRVLRGPRAQGTAVAHLVTLHDDWTNFTGVIEPIDLKNLPDPDPRDQPAAPRRPHFSLVTSDGDPIPTSVLDQVMRLYADHAAIASQGAYISRADLIGYYETAEMRIPVFKHQQDSLDALISDLLRGESLQGHPPLTYFADDPLPHPTARHLAELVRETRDTGARPAFRECRVVVTPDGVAGRILAAGALTEQQRREHIENGWAEGGALSFASFDHWHEAVDAKVRELVRRRRGSGTVCDPEEVARPIQARTVPRDLGPLFRETVDQGRRYLDSDDTRARLARLPAVKWSEHGPLKTLHAYWTLHRKGPHIVVSSALQVSTRYVSDEVLRYLLWHELLHHVLPGHGHDAEFRLLEARWPHALDLDRDLDTLHEGHGSKPRSR